MCLSCSANIFLFFGNSISRQFGAMWRCENKKKKKRIGFHTDNVIWSQLFTIFDLVRNDLTMNFSSHHNDREKFHTIVLFICHLLSRKKKRFFFLFRGVSVSVQFWYRNSCCCKAFHSNLKTFSKQCRRRSFRFKML